MSKGAKKSVVQKKEVSFRLVNPMSAGIDVSVSEMVVAIPEGLQEVSVRAFGTMTCDLRELCNWLEECEIETVAMESTGIYWQPLFFMLLSAGFDVCLVNAAHVKNVSGRKTDESDAQWIQKLHSCGLLSGSYLPEDVQRSIRNLTRTRRSYTEEQNKHLNRIQKELESMNIKFHTIINSIAGVSGMAVLQAILDGERNPENFLIHIDRRVKASREEIIKSLEGNWDPTHLFLLAVHVASYKECQKTIEGLEKELENKLVLMEAKVNHGEIKTQMQPGAEKRKTRNSPKGEVEQHLKNIHGVDVLAIYGMGTISALEILAETGTDLSKWPSENHFVSWLNLCPNNKRSGGKELSSKVARKRANPASQAFKSAANAVQRSQNSIGDYFRRMKSKGGNKYAILATANKMAKIYYRMITEKQEFKPIDLQEYRDKFKQDKIAYLERRLQLLKNEAA
jgi:transposase